VSARRSRRADFLLTPGPANARAALHEITGGEAIKLKQKDGRLAVRRPMEPGRLRRSAQ